MVKYEFVTGEVIEIEVSEEFEEVIVEMERVEYNNHQSETRRHRSLESMEELGFQFEDRDFYIEEIVEREEELRELREAMDKLLPQQRELIRQVYFEEKTLTEIADELGVYPSTAYRRSIKICEELKKYFV